MTDVRGSHSQNASPALPKENGHTAPSPPQPNFPHPSETTIPDDTPASSTSELTQTWVHFAKTFVLIFPIYALGYFEFSFSWLLIGLVIFFWWRRNTGGKQSRLSRAIAFFEQEEQSAKCALTTSDLPPWVHFPDVERVEWLNKTVKQMWPYICQFVEKLFHDVIEPAVKESNAHLSTFSFTKFDMGDKPLRINGVKVYTENVDKRQIIMDLQISFVGNTEIEVDIKRYYCKAGIKSIQLVDINWTVNSNFNFSFPSRNKLAKLRFPMPKGVLRIHFLEAQDLEGKDTFLGGLIKGKSDPYGILQIGNQLFQSKTIKESLNPKWNEVYEVRVGDWFDLEEATTGKLHLKLEWLSLLSTSEKLDQVLQSVRADRSLANDGLSSALLVVYLDSAKNLPSAKKNTSDPSPYVHFRVGHKTLESKIRYKTKEPLWEDCFSFLVHNPRRQELEVEVKDDKNKCTLGNLTVPLSSLLVEKDMTLNQRFPLKNSGPSSTIKLKMALRILSLEKQVSPDQPSSVQVNKSGVPQAPPASSLRPSASDSPLPPPTHSHPIEASTLNLKDRDGEPYGASHRYSTTNLTTAMSSSQKHLPHNKSTASLASDISLPIATVELQQRLRHGSAPSQYPLGEIQLTVRHSSQRNKLIVVVHACRNLIAFTKDGSDPFIRLYLLPDKSRTGKRKTSTMKRTLNPVYDQTFEFSVSIVELYRRTLDVAVKNGGSILSKHKGLLGKVSPAGFPCSGLRTDVFIAFRAINAGADSKHFLFFFFVFCLTLQVLVDLSGDDIAKGITQW
uniref:Extended synaptotagmin-like protein 2b n=1 Tax=Astatotilapia calliptera TaxID=8154 RepID=A0AAX7VMX2_ASTCA